MKIREKERDRKGRMNDGKVGGMNNEMMLENFNFIEQQRNDAGMSVNGVKFN